MGFVNGQGWGMDFIVSPNYIPQNPEYAQHYKPEQQGCAECNGVSYHQRQKFSPRQVLTCNGLMTVESTPRAAPGWNREMDVNAGAYGGVAAIPTKKHTRVINRSTRSASDVQTIVVDPQDVV